MQIISEDKTTELLLVYRQESKPTEKLEKEKNLKDPRKITKMETGTTGDKAESENKNMKRKLLGN